MSCLLFKFSTSDILDTLLYEFLILLYAVLLVFAWCSFYWSHMLSVYFLNSFSWIFAQEDASIYLCDNILFVTSTDDIKGYIKISFLTSRVTVCGMFSGYKLCLYVFTDWITPKLFQFRLQHSYWTTSGLCYYFFFGNLYDVHMNFIWHDADVIMLLFGLNRPLHFFLNSSS